MKSAAVKRDIRWWARYVAATVLVGFGLTFGLEAALYLGSMARIDALYSAMGFIMSVPAGWFYLNLFSFLPAGLIVWRIRTR